LSRIGLRLPASHRPIEFTGAMARRRGGGGHSLSARSNQGGCGASASSLRCSRSDDEISHSRAGGAVTLAQRPTLNSHLANARERRAYSCKPDMVHREVGGLELRNVVANYPFESSRGFPGSEPNSGPGDHSRLSCSAGDTQPGTGFCRDLQQAFCTDVGHHAASPRRHELAAISFDQKMIRRRQSQQHHYSVCAGLSAQRERVW
jgi:hypothetical protein